MENKNVRLEDWSVVMRGEHDSYLAPEQLSKYLSGKVYGHPRCEDGRSVQTSSIVEVNGRFVKTKNNTTYELGKPSEAYEAWVLSTTSKPIDSENPIKIRY